MLQITLETVTPLFLGGADPRGAPELRAASVRGALRYWLRALLGGVLGDSNLNALRQAESAVFGSTDSASPVVVRVQHNPFQTQPFSQITEWDHRTSSYRKPGIAYLFFAMRGTRAEPERMAINAGSSFELVLSKRSGVDASDDQALKQASAALWLLTHLGGLGARSRRGAGSLQVMKATGEPNGLPPLCVRATDPDGLQKELKDGLKCLRKLVQTGSSGRVGNPSAFDILHPDVCKVWVINKSFNSWSDALEAIGGAMQGFRNCRPPDYPNVKDAVQGQPLTQPVQRAAFGLPIVFYYRSLGGQRGTLEGEHHDRRASPLCIHVTKLANGQYAVVLTVFYAHLLEVNEQLKLERPGAPCFITPPGLNLINNFLKYLDNAVGQRLEVTGW